MLTLEERRIAARAVAIAISGAEYPRSVLLAWVSEVEFRLYFSTTPQNAMALAEEAIRMCEDSQWEHMPPWLQQILSKVAETTEIKRILDKIQTPPPGWRAPAPPVASADPFNDVWLHRPGLPFINRLRLRESLRKLNAPTGPSVLIINGPTQSGKSYSVELLNHAVQENALAGGTNPPVPICLIKLERGMGASLSPEALARMIINRITTNPTPLPDATQDSVTPDRMNEHLCKWIIDNASATGQQWWVVLDGLNDEDLMPVTRNFISKMVELLSAEHQNKKLRLIIIDYPPELVAGIQLSQIELEQLYPIGEVDLIEFLEKQFEKYGGAPVPPQAVRAGAMLVMLNLPEDNTRLRVLNEKLIAFVKNLSKESANV